MRSITSASRRKPQHAVAALDQDARQLSFFSAFQEKLTFAPVDGLARLTFPGMAHFGSTGPANTTCRGCKFWRHGPYDCTKAGKIKAATCAKFSELMRGVVGPPIPDTAPSCRHFEPRKDVPLRYSR